MTAPTYDVRCHLPMSEWRWGGIRGLRFLPHWRWVWRLLTRVV